MNDLMELLYGFTKSRRLAGHVDCRSYEEAEQVEARNLAALRQDLYPKQLEILGKYQDACQEHQMLELEAMFLAAFSVARELP